jgi:hypothetical protein
MRTLVPPAMLLPLVLALPLQTAPVAAQDSLVPAGPALTAATLIGDLRHVAEAITEDAGADLRDVATRSVRDLDELADRLAATYGNDLDRPLIEHGQNGPGAVQQAVAALTVAESFLASLRTCTRENVRALLAALEVNIDHVVRDGAPFSGGRPHILRVANLEGEPGYGVRAGTVQSISLEGLNLASDDCGPVTASLRTDGGSIEVDAELRGEQRVVVSIPAMSTIGVHELSIRLRHRKLLFFCGSSTARVSIVLLPAAPLRIRYSITSTRSVEQEIVWNAGELKEGNENCDTVATASRLFRLPEGWTYRSHNWVVFLNAGSTKEKEEVRGNGVYIQYRLPLKGGALCTGPTRLIHGRMEIVGTRTSTEAGPSADGRYGRAIGFGDSVTIPVNIKGAHDPSIGKWSVQVRVVYPDGSVRSIPDGSVGASPTASRGRDGSFSWDPQTRRLMVSTPRQACRKQGQRPSSRLRERGPAIRAPGRLPFAGAP